jgi:predicted SnoaL-like aldol condensation-catalyzing enzyme
MGGSADAVVAAAAQAGDLPTAVGAVLALECGEAPMRRRSPVCLVAAALALATGLVLYQMGALLSEASPTPAPAANARPAERLVGAFYDAVDEALRGGQSAALDRLLAPAFVDHGGHPDLPPTRAGFLRHLRALAATFPALRLREGDTFAHGDLVVAHVTIDGTGQGTFLGLPLADAPPPWGAVDVFRIADGALAEHWGGDAAAPGLDPFGQWPFAIPPVALQTLALTRTSLDAGDSAGLGSPLGPEAVFVEAGRLAVAIAPGTAGPARLWRAADADADVSPTAEAPGAAAVLAAGDLLLVPQGVGATAGAEGGGPATYLSVGLHRPAGPTGPAPATTPPAAAPSPPATPGEVVADLAGSLPVALPGGPARLGLGRVALAPGAALPVRAPGVAVVVVEEGSLALADTAGVVWSRHAADGGVTTATGGVLTPGDAIVVEAGAGGDLRNAGNGPLALPVLTLTPAV